VRTCSTRHVGLSLLDRAPGRSNVQCKLPKYHHVRQYRAFSAHAYYRISQLSQMHTVCDTYLARLRGDAVADGLGDAAAQRGDQLHQHQQLTLRVSGLYYPKQSVCGQQQFQGAVNEICKEITSIGARSSNSHLAQNVVQSDM
jgi:hypothetical protein